MTRQEKTTIAAVVAALSAEVDAETAFISGGKKGRTIPQLTEASLARRDKLQALLLKLSPLTEGGEL